MYTSLCGTIVLSNSNGIDSWFSQPLQSPSSCNLPERNPQQSRTSSSSRTRAILRFAFRKSAGKRENSRRPTPRHMGRGDGVLKRLAQATPRPDPVLVAILREGATCWHSLGSATQVRCYENWCQTPLLGVGSTPE
jgi:hypothetical protein